MVSPSTVPDSIQMRPSKLESSIDRRICGETGVIRNAPRDPGHGSEMQRPI